MAQPSLSDLGLVKLSSGTHAQPFEGRHKNHNLIFLLSLYAVISGGILEILVSYLFCGPHRRSFHLASIYCTCTAALPQGTRHC